MTGILEKLSGENKDFFIRLLMIFEYFNMGFRDRLLPL